MRLVCRYAYATCPASALIRRLQRLKLGGFAVLTRPPAQKTVRPEVTTWMRSPPITAFFAGTALILADVVLRGERASGPRADFSVGAACSAGGSHDCHDRVRRRGEPARVHYSQRTCGVRRWGWPRSALQGSASRGLPRHLCWLAGECGPGRSNQRQDPAAGRFPAESGTRRRAYRWIIFAAASWFVSSRGQPVVRPRALARAALFLIPKPPAA